LYDSFESKSEEEGFRKRVEMDVESKTVGCELIELMDVLSLVASFLSTKVSSVISRVPSVPVQSMRASYELRRGARGEMTRHDGWQ
jgi:hypothetical protein